MISYPFSFNKAQLVVIPHIDESDCNLVVSFPTATGKSVIADLAIDKAMGDGKKAIYISPLKALLEEKAEDWSKEGPLKAKCVIRSRDNHPTTEEYKKADIILTTLEGFGFMARSNSEFLKDVGLIVFDEAHYLGDADRGSGIEGSLILFCSRFNTRLIFLSATMSNADKISKWAKALNGRKSLCFVSQWRPNKVDIFFHYVEGWMVNEVVDEILKSKTKTIVFVQSKKTGKEIVKAVRAKGKRCSFYNASVGKNLRKRMEDAFSELDGVLDCLISTSSLGAGVNL